MRDLDDVIAHLERRRAFAVDLGVWLALLALPAWAVWLGVVAIAAGVSGLFGADDVWRRDVLLPVSLWCAGAVWLVAGVVFTINERRQA